jgi:hypothetical protein
MYVFLIEKIKIKLKLNSSIFILHTIIFRGCVIGTPVHFGAKCDDR